MSVSYQIIVGSIMASNLRSVKEPNALSHLVITASTCENINYTWVTYNSWSINMLHLMSNYIKYLYVALKG